MTRSAADDADPAPRLGPLRGALASVRLRSDVHRYAMRVLDDLGHAPLLHDADPPRLPRTSAVGPDPIRVLVFGGGLAVGYGVRSRDEAFDGPLVRLLAARTGRGVVLENFAEQHSRIPDAVGTLGAVGTHTYAVAIWCPSFAEGLERLRPASWRTALHAMVRDLRRHEVVPLVLTEMPVPAGYHPAALLARPWVHRLNRVIRQVAEEHDAVVAVPTEPFTAREVGQPVTDAPYFAAVAARIESGVAAVLRLGQPDRVEDPTRVADGRFGTPSGLGGPPLGV